MLLAVKGIRNFDYKIKQGLSQKEGCQKYGQVKVSSWPLLSHFAKVMDDPKLSGALNSNGHGSLKGHRGCSWLVWIIPD